ncbi:cupredoxin domain-containing protein [Halocatena salina]|uniref:Blue (type 1) copper domain-containing protein n=1 Tax=Halocatena salina TaxID=2934340 RepID=A0A8U0A8I4_9EURY|nr:hypothetical protein [Halocatena salina]UPM45169.1 hypothetical protein MW046_17580 [Halocatena salina]
MDRRTMLKFLASGSVASFASVSGCINVRFTVPPDPASGAYSHESYTLGAKTTGWRGIAPDEIRSELNPELKFRPGKTIRLRWTVLDGTRHKIIIENSVGKTLYESKENSDRGETRTITFESSQEMTTYYCPYHPIQMRGDVLCTDY